MHRLLLGVLLQLHCLLLECLLQDLQFLLLLSRDQIDGVKSRGLDKEVDAPTGDTKVFNDTRGNFFNSTLIGYQPILFMRIKTRQGFRPLLCVIR